MHTVTSDKKDIEKWFQVDPRTVYHVQKLSVATGGFKKHKQSGQSGTVRTKLVVEIVMAKMKAHPRLGMPQTAKDLEVHNKAVEQTVKQDLGIKSRDVANVQLLTEAQWQKEAGSSHEHLKPSQDCEKKISWWMLWETPGLLDTKGLRRCHHRFGTRKG